jgi:hypothetical protein
MAGGRLIRGLVLLTLGAGGALAGTFTESAFPQKLIFSETPEVGHAWHGGLRMHDVLIWDGYWNVGGWFTLDVLSAGGFGSQIPRFLLLLLLDAGPSKCYLMFCSGAGESRAQDVSVQH